MNNRVYVSKNMPLNASSGDAHMQDSVELFFSERNFKGNYGSVAEGNQYRINYLGARSQKTANDGWTGSGMQNNTGNGYILTYRIPWVDNSIEKETGIVFGLDFQINAMENPTTRTCFAWSDSTDSGYTTSQNWGEIVLAAAE